jgi:nucleoside 2-deoxyribosyltransferase
MKNKKVYISIPYTGFEDISYQLTNQVAASLLDAGAIPISPISHSHPIEVEAGKSWSWDIWKKVDYALLDMCDTILVVNFNQKAVEKSTGVQDEIKYAKKKGKDVEFLDVEIEYSFNVSNFFK